MGLGVKVAVGGGVTTGVGEVVCVGVVVGVMIEGASVEQPILPAINAIINDAISKTTNLFIAGQIIACTWRRINATYVTSSTKLSRALVKLAI